MSTTLADTRSTPSAPPSAIRVALGGLVALASALGIGRFVFTPILPVMAAALHLTKSEAGAIASANFVGYLVGAMAAASPRFGEARRRWLLVGLAVNAAALLAMPLTTDFSAFLLIRLLAGIASGFVMVFGSALVIEHLQRVGRGGLSSLYFAGPGTGITTSAVVVALLSAVGVGWMGLWAANGVIATLGLGFVAWAIPADAPLPAGTKTSAPGRMTRAFVLLAIAYGLVGFGYVITSTFIVTLVRETPSVASLEPWVWILVGLSSAPSAVIWAFWSRRSGVMTAFAIASLAEALGVAVSVLWPTFAGVVLAAILLGGTFVGLTALGLVAARGMLAGDPRRGIAILTAVFGIGQIVGPLVAGVLHDLTGDFVLASILAAVALVGSAGLALAAGRDT